MNERHRELCRQLRAMPSEAAASWLIATYPLDDFYYLEGVLLARHRSWERKDQLRLAEHFLQRIPFAHAKPYEAFASFMSIASLVRVISKFVPALQPDQIDLLRYHLRSVLTAAARTAADRRVVEEFMALLDIRAIEGARHDA